MNLLWLMTPQYQNRDNLYTTTQTWQMNLLWLMDPPVPEQRWLAYHYTKLGRWTYFCQCTSWYQSRDDLHTTTQNLADEPTLANGPPPVPQQRWLAYSTPQNFADEPTLANGPPQYQSRMSCIPLHKIWQMKPTLAEHNGKGLKALAFTMYEIPNSIFSKHIFA